MDGEKFDPTDELINLFEAPDKFLEFYHKYPHKVTDGYGRERILKVKNPESVAGKKAREKYMRITKGNPQVTKDIITGLENELKHRSQNGSMQYMQMLSTWLNSGNWEAYLTFEDKKSEKEDEII